MERKTRSRKGEVRRGRLAAEEKVRKKCLRKDKE